ncbi:hypothetical protein F5Y17DRAFT_294806 [Xylariaceae sp. FL0594]|nr:hypothetical protein F5Y17DRAFT_294806 [Xylariaceae sp. FL0594]
MRKVTTMSSSRNRNRKTYLLACLKLVVLSSFFFTSGAMAWRSTLAFEYDKPGCRGRLNRAWVGSRWKHIKMSNTTQSVFTSTVNDGIYRWYGFPSTTADGLSCQGDVVGRLYSSCFDLTSFAVATAENHTDSNRNNEDSDKLVVRCIRYCTLWAGAEDPLSCAFFGEGES